MPGSTAPVTIAGAVAMCNAEELAGIVLTKLINPGNPVIYLFASYGSNVQTGNASIGTPELIKAGRYGSLLAKKYGLACRCGGGLTDAKGVTAQAGVETAMCLMHNAYYKGNLVQHSAGILDSFATMSYEKLMLDFEVIDRLANYMEDIEVNENTLALKTLKKVAETEGIFLNQKHTVKNCRKAYIPQVSLRTSLPEGMDPNKQLYDSMHNRMEKQLAAYVKPELDSEIEKQLDDFMLSIGMKQEDIDKLLDNLINIVVIISSAIVAILTFADIEYFRIIFKYINQESFTLLVGILASIIFIITLVQQYLNLSTKSDESEIAIKRITNFIRDTSSLKNEENIDEKKFNQILEDYKKINEENPVIPDYIFIRAKSKLNQKIQISRYIDKYPMKKIRHIKKELRNKSIEEIDKLLE